MYKQFMISCLALFFWATFSTALPARPIDGVTRTDAGFPGSIATLQMLRPTDNMLVAGTAATLPPIERQVEKVLVNDGHQRVSFRQSSPLIHLKVMNSSLLPHKYTLIGYEPGQAGNWTSSFVLMPGACRSLNLPVGTKVYQANDQQIGVVMDGGNIRNDVPFIFVKAEDEEKVFRLK